MEAPDKIYVTIDRPEERGEHNPELLGCAWTEKDDSCEHIEYIRKDLLFEWAKELASEPYNRTTESARKIQIAHYLLEKYDSL